MLGQSMRLDSHAVQRAQGFKGCASASRFLPTLGPAYLWTVSPDRSPAIATLKEVARQTVRILPVIMDCYIPEATQKPSKSLKP